MARKQLYINGVGTGDYGIYISSDTYLNAPEPDMTAHTVPGRNGDLIQWNKRLNNIIRKFECYIPNNAQSNFDGFKKLIYSNVSQYMEISSDYESDTFQRGYLADEIEAEPFQKDGNLTVTFELYFSCEPQKYSKTNTPVSEVVYGHMPVSFPRNIVMLRRSHPVVQTILKNIPPDAVPSDDMFMIVSALPTSFEANGNGIFFNEQFEMDGYEGFVATAVIVNFVWFHIDSYQKSVIMGEYSTTGVIDSTAEINVPAFPTAASYELVYMLPVTAQGTADMSCDFRWASQSQSTSYSTTTTFNSLIDDYEADKLGLSYTIALDGKIRKSVNPDVSYKYNALCVVGKLNGKKTFQAYIDIDGTILKDLCPEDSTLYDMHIEIDSETYKVTGVWNNTTEVEMTGSSSISGDMDGLADEVEVIFYRDNGQSGYPMEIRRVTVTPRWWKI